ncbi:hypothetical protein ACIRG5_45690 [Lentzea sp. NPDC102401]|uniref:hypothetical protein n=1 Tax=Lentzea sp. NPDC102401 TaxID=3364128 RepID=UPI00380CFFBF
MQHQNTAANAWAAAADVREYLARGGALPTVHSPVPLDADEHAVAVLNHHTGSAFHYERYLCAEVTVPTPGPTVIVGPPAFVAGAVAMNALRRARAQHQAQAAAAWQWRPSPVMGVTLTTKRLWVHPYGTERRHFTFDSITGLWLHDSSMTLEFAQVAAMRLTGAAVPWLAVVIEHYHRCAGFGPAHFGWSNAAAG